MSESLLKPCPFCGGAFYLLENGKRVAEMYKRETGKDLFAFKCASCKKEVLLLEHGGTNATVEMNRRADSDRIAELEKQLPQLAIPEYFLELDDLKQRIAQLEKENAELKAANEWKWIEKDGLPKKRGFYVTSYIDRMTGAKKTSNALFEPDAYSRACQIICVNEFSPKPLIGTRPSKSIAN